MCLRTARYSCCHTKTKRMSCRRTWRKKTGWLCYPVVCFIFGTGPEDPCDEVRADWNLWVSSSCPECREAEEHGTPTKGRVYDRYRHRLMPEELSRARHRKEEEDRQRVLERGMSRAEAFQLQQLRTRPANNEYDKALPAMPSFAHVPLSDRWGQPTYHYPQQIALKFPPAPPAGKPLPQTPPQDTTQDQEETLKNGPVIGADRAGRPWTSVRQAVQQGDENSKDWYAMAPRRLNDGRNPYRPYENELKARNLTHLNVVVPQPSGSLSGPSQSSHPAAANNTDRPAALIADRRGRQIQPLTVTPPSYYSKSQTPAAQPSAKSAGRKGVLRMLNNATRSDISLDAPSETISFVCKDARNVERVNRH